jgi:hypothetical protein
MSRSRVQVLLAEVARGFEEEKMGFPCSFMIANEVTSEECAFLSVVLSSVLRGYLLLPEHMQACFAVASVSQNREALLNLAKQGGKNNGKE